MPWLVDLFTSESIAQATLILSVVVGLGLALGSLKFRKLGLGIAGVLFAGLIVGHILGKAQIHINKEVMEFAREFGLILFVYTIGVQVGPGFFDSLRRQGLALNLMAAAIVLLGVMTAVGVHRLGGVDLPVAVGLFSGATTNTPSLAAAQQALKDVPGVTEAAAKMPGLGYAVAYPFGIVGIILTMLMVRGLFRIDPARELELLNALNAAQRPSLRTVNLELRNPNLDGLPLRQIPTLAESGVVISRVMQNGQAHAARGDMVLGSGDVLLAVGPPDKLEQLRLIIGQESSVDVKSAPGNVVSRRVVVTHNGALGRTVDDLDLRGRLGVNVTRVSRAEIELPPHDVRLQFGDRLLVVGDPDAVQKAAFELGDSVKELNHPQIVPIFVGIAVGVLVGSYPLHLPGVPAPVKLGLAGGPLIVAILLARVGRIGPLRWSLPISANTVLREVGIALFLACVGLRSGDKFIETLVAGDGLFWMGMGALITLAPLVLVGLAARAIYRVNYLSLCGLLAGSMTDPPALAFAGSITGSDAPNISYATVYPLVMLLRVLSAQLMVLLLA